MYCQKKILSPCILIMMGLRTHTNRKFFLRINQTFLLELTPFLFGPHTYYETLDLKKIKIFKIIYVIGIQIKLFTNYLKKKIMTELCFQTLILYKSERHKTHSKIMN